MFPSPTPAKPPQAAISPDGKYIASIQLDAGQQSIWLRNVPTKSNTQIVAPTDDRYDAVTFSPDGNSIYFLRRERDEIDVDSLYRLPVLGGAPERVIHDVDSNVSFSPDGARFTFVRYKRSEGEGDLMIANVDGSGEKMLAKQTAQISSPRWSPDGKVIAAVEPLTEDASTTTIETFDASSGQKSVLLKSGMLLDSLAWLPDGHALLVLAADATSNYNRRQIGIVSYPTGGISGGHEGYQQLPQHQPSGRRKIDRHNPIAAARRGASGLVRREDFRGTRHCERTPSLIRVYVGFERQASSRTRERNFQHER